MENFKKGIIEPSPSSLSLKELEELASVPLAPVYPEDLILSSDEEEGMMQSDEKKETLLLKEELKINEDFLEELENPVLYQKEINEEGILLYYPILALSISEEKFQKTKERCFGPDPKEQKKNEVTPEIWNNYLTANAYEVRK